MPPRRCRSGRPVAAAASFAGREEADEEDRERNALAVDEVPLKLLVSTGPRRRHGGRRRRRQRRRRLGIQRGVCTSIDWWNRGCVPDEGNLRGLIRCLDQSERSTGDGDRPPPRRQNNGCSACGSQRPQRVCLTSLSSVYPIESASPMDTSVPHVPQGALPARLAGLCPHVVGPLRHGVLAVADAWCSRGVVGSSFAPRATDFEYGRQIHPAPKKLANRYSSISYMRMVVRGTFCRKPAHYNTYE